MIDRNNCYFCKWYYEENDTGATECCNNNISDVEWENHFVDEEPNCPYYCENDVGKSA